jgi:hypothetical protein
MKKISEIVIQKVNDDYPDISYLGTFSNTPAAQFSILRSEEITGVEKGTYPYFNAANVDSMEQAMENYQRALAFDRGDVVSLGVRAAAHVKTSANGKEWMLHTIKTGGLYGVDSDSEQDYFSEIATQELAELCDVLREFGFTQQDIDNALSTVRWEE